MDIFNDISKKFWNEEIWLPPNTTWADRVSTPENGYPNFMDLWTYPFGVALFLTILRYFVLNRLVYGPIASYLGLKNVQPRRVIPNAVAENIFLKYKKKIPENVLINSAKEINWSERKLERWIRARAGMNRMNVYTKFLECCWQLTYYSFAVIYATFILYNEPWMYNIKIIWDGYPNNKIGIGMWYHYMISLGFYWSMTSTHFLETRRKDFYQMFIHHLVTIALMVLSFTLNFTYIGSLVLFLHDIADVPLQLSKIFIYLKWKKLCDTTFLIFTISWIITRCGIYPFIVVKNVMVDATDVVPMHPVYYIFSSLLCSLAVLHFYWTYFILRIIVNTAVKGEIEDDRSSSEEEPVGQESFSSDVLKQE